MCTCGEGGSRPIYCCMCLKVTIIISFCVKKKNVIQGNILEFLIQ